MTNAELKARWLERVRTGNFSQAVLGLGQVRVMGTSGDEPFNFPRVISLAVLDQPDNGLEADEVWAVRTAEAIVNQSRAQGNRSRGRQVFGRASRDESMSTIKGFAPELEDILVTNMIAGG